MNSNAKTSLFLSIKNNNPEILRSLLNRGVDPDTKFDVPFLIIFNEILFFHIFS